MSKEFTVTKQSLILEFLTEVEFPYEDIALKCIKSENGNMTDKEVLVLYEKYQDVFHDELYELSEFIDQYYAGEYEVDEGSGTWDYVKFYIPNLEEVQKSLAEEVEILFNQAIKRTNI